MKSLGIGLLKLINFMIFLQNNIKCTLYNIMVVKQFKQTAIIIGEKYDEKLLDVIINYYKKDKMVIISVNKIFLKIHITAYCEEVGSDLINLVLELQCTNIITIGQINLE